eukprot:jgi/Botrbrau1/12430/Bobra.0229s0026.1
MWDGYGWMLDLYGIDKSIYLGEIDMGGSQNSSLCQWDQGGMSMDGHGKPHADPRMFPSIIAEVHVGLAQQLLMGSMLDSLFIGIPGVLWGIPGMLWGILGVLWGTPGVLAG